MKLRNPLIIFYVLSGYILLQVLWWIAYQLRINEQLREEQLEVGASSESLAIIQEEFNKKFYMILGEGLVFTILLLFGMFVMFRVLRQQIALARAQRNFLLSVTHELKTPISAIHLMLETLKKRDLKPEVSDQLIDDALAENARLASLTENMLLSARIEKTQDLLSFESVDLSALVDGTVAQVSRTTGQNHNFVTSIASGITMTGDHQFLEALVMNLLTNSIKYSEEGSNIEVSLERSGDQSLLQVTDQGIGIPSGDKDQIFKKFFRVEDEQIRKSKGTGLGLFLVKEIARIHGGSVKVNDNNPKGSVFEVALNTK